MLKKLLSSYVFFILCSANCLGSTTVNAGAVSGIWTSAGSPYLIQGDIVVNQGQTLQIQAGVEVVFQGFYKFTVPGRIQCLGNAAAPVIFRASDTTGWAIDSLAPGGWAGFDLFDYTYQGTDTNRFEYCHIRDTKTGPLLYSQYMVLNNNRNLVVKNSKFYHNQRTASTSNAMLFNLTVDSVHHVVFEDNQFYDNLAARTIVSVIGYSSNILLNAISFLNNEFYQNTTGNVIYGMKLKGDFRFNSIHHNTQNGMYHGTVILEQDESSIYHNRFYFNTTGRLGALCLSKGNTVVDGNLICNNFLNYGNCGISDGGAALWLNGKFLQPDPDHTFLIKNNVIANNYSVYLSGGIKVYQCNARIVNNTIVNNASEDLGSGMTITAPYSDVVVKNNIFKGNSNVGQPLNSFLSDHDIYALSFGSLYLNYNAFELPLSQIVYLGSGSLPVDTNLNKIAQNPNFINPTASASNTDDATLRDFGIQWPSTMIDQGDTVGVFASPLDFKLSTRIVNNRIDIGAIEYNNFAQGFSESGNDQPKLILYPNPCHDELHWDSKEKVRQVEILLTNGQVKQLIPLAPNSSHIQVSELPAGYYFLRINQAVYPFRKN
ncbi:MAG: hypothetical protein JNM44_00525, partial [Chitinophagaceae bacterium]|nr:hypothetical protein [Chitinophagaceae bacterium]